MSDLTDTRDDLLDALCELVSNAPDKSRKRLAEALETFATARGQVHYRRIAQDTPLMKGLLEAIEEGSDALLFNAKTKDSQ